MEYSKPMALNYKAMIESGFDIVDKHGNRRPFLLNPVQDLYLKQLKADYPDMEGIRENDLKARQEGFSSLIDAILTCDFLAYENCGGQIVSHKEKETETLMNRVSFYIESFCEKRGINREDLLKVDTKHYMETFKGSYLFIGTAGAKTLGRGGTLQNIHWSEPSFYPNTEILNAEKLVSAAEQQVLTGVGKIFRESTGNMMGDYFFRECERSRKGESNFKFRFFPWFLMPEYRSKIESSFNATPEEEKMMQDHGLEPEQMLWYRKKSMEFETHALFIREYPTVPEECFLASGESYFDKDALVWYYENVRTPYKEGQLAFDGQFL